MRIPKKQNLCNQSFSSEQIEFIWHFDDVQFICNIKADGSIYLETGKVDSFGDYVDKLSWAELGSETQYDNLGAWIENNPVYKNFTNGTDLRCLVEDAVDYLKN